MTLSSRLSRVIRDVNGGAAFVGEFARIMVFPDSSLPLIVICESEPEVTLWIACCIRSKRPGARLGDISRNNLYPYCEPGAFRASSSVVADSCLRTMIK